MQIHNCDKLAHQQQNANSATGTWNLGLISDNGNRYCIIIESEVLQADYIFQYLPAKKKQV